MFSEPEILSSKHQLVVLSPLDGRYFSKTAILRPWFSEAAFMKYRVIVEIQWLITLSHSKIKEISNFSKEVEVFLQNLIFNFNLEDVTQIKNIEKNTNHDIKAVEYWLRKKCQSHKELQFSVEFIHFACTSEDINNIAYALMLKGARDCILVPKLRIIYSYLVNLAYKYAKQPMLSRTHGQPASPTTLGKEIANVAMRLKSAIEKIEKINILAKMNGAVGNYNAHLLAYPNINWIDLTRNFIEKILGLTFNLYTTQIEPHDYIAELFDAIARSNTILIDFNKNIWSYISFGYFNQKIKSEEEIGSSTMPHKVNPIDFENSEANLGIANAMLRHLSEKLPISRLQRDLTDSTTLRNIGVIFGYILVAYETLITGIKKLEVNFTRLTEDLEPRWEILAEPIQTMMRRYGIKNSYEKLRKLTQGKTVTKEDLHAFINELIISDIDKKRLLKMTPATYIGQAAFLAENIH